MKIKNITNVDRFFQVVDGCSGRIELVTSEGDRLNLKSKLSQYVSLTKFFSASEIMEIELIAENPEDIKKLLEFVIRG